MTSPISDSVNIPFAELGSRTAELPPKDATLRIAGPDSLADQVAEFLRKADRTVNVSTDWQFGENSNFGRLWEPNEWLAECCESLTAGRALDLGCGTGRDAVYLAALGWRVLAADKLPDAIERGRDLASRYLDAKGQGRIDWLTADLLAPDFEPADSFDLIFNAFFFDRALIERAIGWLRPGGNLVVEAFTSVHQAMHGKPARASRVVGSGELRELAAGLEILRFEEGDHSRRHTARLWARKA